MDGVIVEVNAARISDARLPSRGIPRNGRAVLNMLFPADGVPPHSILAVTGTNGKTTTTRLLAHIFKQTGRTGYTTTDGTYRRSLGRTRGQYRSPKRPNDPADPTVEVAVLESARGGICDLDCLDASNVGVVLNVAARSPGNWRCNTVEQMAHLKSVASSLA